MDAFLRGDYFKFWIDDIFIDKHKKLNALLIPNINSKYFPPFHLRTIRFHQRFLSHNYAKGILGSKLDYPESYFKSAIEQGAYYEIPTNMLLQQKNVFSTDGMIKDDIFSNHKKKSPFKDNLKGEINYNTEKTTNILSENNINNPCKVHLYCFYVGQGDSFLLITSNRNAYLIDSNFYSQKSVENHIDVIKKILIKHKIKNNRIKGIILTHKHIDHLRGLHHLINSNSFNIDYFLFNQDYKHPTKCVAELLDTAQNRIPKWINVNDNFDFKDGSTEFSIFNPDETTAVNEKTPDINNSSISFVVKYGNHSIILTGDTGYKILNEKLKSPLLYNSGEKLIKISHHGSRTGTNNELLKTVNPQFAFISVGNSLKYGHPHKSVLNSIDSFKPNIDYKESKLIKKHIHYTLSKDTIRYNYL